MPSVKRIGNTPSVDVIAGNEDLLFEILVHLPPKSLLRFQCVSKHWLSLISNPQFRSHHSRRNPNSVATALFYYKKFPFPEFGFLSLKALENPTNNTPFHFLDFLSTFNEVIYAHSCNGLLFVELWRDSGESLTHVGDRVSYFYKKGVYWNGAIHWVSTSQPFLCFDVDEEHFKAMPSTLIPKGRSERKIKYFGVSGDHFHLIEIYGPRRTVFDVLEMEGDYSKWVAKFRVDLDASISIDNSPRPGGNFSILSLFLEEKEGRMLWKKLVQFGKGF
ncbi:F-box protein At5g07610-like [Cornus florida]|uniref:F-box protein At5g07610-like n=1 Tax=Cornus florida TaxID=4283 RepID=UPI0028998C27|nr:F-box protein At5g07610-like [Cornus florida]